MNKTFLSVVILAGILASCNLTKKTIEPVEEVAFSCDETITYAAVIKPIFDARCTGCHSGQKPAYGIDLTTYESASKVTGHRLSCVVDWEDNCNKMPPSGGQLSALQRNQIQCWLDNGKKP